MTKLVVSIKNIKLNNETVLFLDHQFNAGQPTLITGKSGKGKTTILKIIANYYKSKKATIKLNGKKLKKNQVAMVFQDFKLIDYENAKYNILLPHKISKSNKSYLEQKLAQLIVDLQIDFSLQSPIKKLSGGQIQKVAILRALLQDFDVFLGDELISNLDDEYSRFIIDYITTNYSDKVLIFVSHDKLLSDYCEEFIELT